MPSSGTTKQRGYTGFHRRLKEGYRVLVEAGVVDCARCGKRILPGQPWDLGHVDGDRTRYSGPEHRSCNRATAGRRRPRHSRRWVA